MFGSNWEESLQRANIGDQGEKHGVIPRAIYRLFEESLEGFSVYCSFIQIYNEKLYDLLEDVKSKNPLVIRENKYNGIYVQGLTEYNVGSMEECLTLLFRGERNRIIRQTRLNMFSSRSHSIFQLLLKTNKADGNGQLKRAKLNLCDLAGSEKVGAEANVSAKHLEELKNINSSLTTLSKVVSALSTKASHVPYRDSKLTRLLQDSIGGNTRTCLIATIAPIADCIDESISTLTLANRAKKIQVIAITNTINASDHTLVKKLQQELQYMKDLLQLKRKGGADGVNRQLLLLKQENDKLRAIHNDWKDIEILKKENIQMRLRLQQIKKCTFNDIDNKRRGENFLTPIKGTEALKQNMTELNRCSICTLPIPCKHHSNGPRPSFLHANLSNATSSVLNQFEELRHHNGLNGLGEKVVRIRVINRSLVIRKY